MSPRVPAGHRAVSERSRRLDRRCCRSAPEDAGAVVVDRFQELLKSQRRRERRIAMELRVPVSPERGPLVALPRVVEPDARDALAKAALRAGPDEVETWIEVLVPQSASHEWSGTAFLGDGRSEALNLSVQIADVRLAVGPELRQRFIDAATDATAGDPEDRSG